MPSFILAAILILLPFNIFGNSAFLENAVDRGLSMEAEDFPYSLGPKLTARSAMVIDAESDNVLFEKNSEEILPIASITKLMTALVFLENKTKTWEDLVEVESGDLIIETESESDLEPAGLNFEAGDKLKVRDVFYGGLIKSANNAMKILSRLTNPCCGKTFVDLMNEKARNIGMTGTYFVEPTGLNPENCSTAQDLAKLIIESMRKDEIKEALERKIYDIQILRPDGSKYYNRARNTNKLLGSFVNLSGAKTGYLEESGYCFAGESYYAGRQLIVIILGAKTSEDRFQEAKALIWWAGQHLTI